MKKLIPTAVSFFSLRSKMSLHFFYVFKRKGCFKKQACSRRKIHANNKSVVEAKSHADVKEKSLREVFIETHPFGLNVQNAFSQNGGWM